MARFLSQLPRPPKVSAPAVIFGSLFVSLALTGMGEPAAQAGPGGSDPQLTHAAASTQDVELRVLDWALWNISKYYVEPDRIDPDAMSLAGLEALEESIPEVLVEPLPERKSIRVRVGNESREFQRDVKALWSVRTHIREVFGYVMQHVTLDAEARQDAEYDVVDAILATLDPHTNLMRADAYEQLKDSTKGSFGGLGIEVGMRKNAITVLRVLEGNPAQKAGIKARDRIVQIDDESAVAMVLDDAVDLLRGPPGSTVRVYIERGEDKTPQRYDITRAEIRLDSVSSDLVPAPKGSANDAPIGVLRLSRNFARTTGQEVRKALRQFEKVGVQGVVLDMRSNPGGLLDAAVEVADAFLSTGTIVSTVGGGTEASESQATDRYDFPDLPVAVLIDQSSASATEIVAGALRNLDRAVLIGRRTFGKGSVQVPHPRRVGSDEIALKLTIAQYLTPGDVSIQSVGVSPDLETWPVTITKDDIAYYSTKRFDLLREESLAAHLQNGSAKQQHVTAGPLHYLQPTLEDQDEEPPQRLEEITDAKKRAQFLLQDPEIRIARNVVAWAPGSDRQTILQQLQRFTKDQQATEDEAITAALKKRDIDWSLGTAPTDDQSARLEMLIRSDREGNVVTGGDTATITVTMTNRGTAPAYRVRTMASSDNASLDERELVFGKIGPGESKSETFRVSVGEYELSRSDRLDFQVHEQFDAPLAPKSMSSLTIERRGLERPSFVFAYQVLDDPKLDKQNIRGNGDGQLQVGEKVLLRIHVGNHGRGDAPEPHASIRSKSGEAIFLTKSRGKLDKIGAGDTGNIDFPFEVRRVPKAGAAQLHLAIVDNKLGEYLSHKIELPVLEGAQQWGQAPNSAQNSVEGEAILYAYPSSDAPAIAKSSKQSRWPVLAQRGDWARVRVGTDAMAFIHRPNWSKKKGRTTSQPVEWSFFVTPPQIKLVESDTHSDQASVHLSGTVTDEERVRDVFITVLNPSRDIFSSAQKVFYQAASSDTAKQLDFAADIPLTPGNNLIEIHARQDDEIIATERMWVLSTKGLDEARRAERTHSARGQLPVDTLKR